VDYWWTTAHLQRPISVLDLNRLAERNVLQLQMDAAGFSDSSVYGQPVSPVVHPAERWLGAWLIAATRRWRYDGAS